MKRLFMLAAALLLSISAHAQTIVGIGSGQQTGTNYPMTDDIVRTCSNATVHYKNVVTDGALDNIFRIYGDKNVQYGIIDEAALVYQQGLDPKMMERIQMVFPFFSMELHLAVPENSPIRSIADLQGKRVYEGAEGSSTWVSTQVIKALTGVNWQGQSFSQTDALPALQRGQVDAIFVVAGKPVGMFSKANGIRLVPISHPKLDSFGYYTKTMIPNGTYPFMKSSVQTYKVNNIIATFAFKNQYQKEIGDLVTCIAHNIGNLQRNGHPKWRDVDPLDIERIKWQAHPAAVAAIKREMKAQSR
jgi:TRAP transporter TAXI family solute receptor